MAHDRADNSASSSPAQTDFQRLLPLQGGNNFRDLGGYKTVENKTVRTGLIFRSGVMTSLTEADQQRLNAIPIRTVVDLRSDEELEIFPNHWAENSGLNFVKHDYSLMDLAAEKQGDQGQDGKVPIQVMYQHFPTALKPQLRLLFQHLVEEKGPLVFNCSAGQDRTGVAGGLILHALGVSWETIIEDYHLSTQYRRPEIEHAEVDFQEAAKTNAFAKYMLRYAKGGSKPAPLLTPDNEPLLLFAFKQIEADYGTVNGYLDQELGLDSVGVEKLKALYLHD